MYYTDSCLFILTNQRVPVLYEVDTLANQAEVV